MYRGNTRVSEKCIACYPRVEGKDPESGGQPMETRCMAACIGQIRMQGLVKMNKDGTWNEDRYNPLYYMVHVAKVALPLYPQFGTEPNGYYIPPRWVPRHYLKQMFGPGVDEAIERYSDPDRELLAVLQLFRRSNRIIFRYEIKEGPKVYEATLRGKKITTVQRHRHRLRQGRQRNFPHHRGRTATRPAGQACKLHMKHEEFKTFHCAPFQSFNPLLHPPPRRGGGKRWGHDERFEPLEPTRDEVTHEP